MQVMTSISKKSGGKGMGGVVCCAAGGCSPYLALARVGTWEWLVCECDYA